MPAGEREPAPSDVTADAAEGLCVGVSEEVVSKTMTLQKFRLNILRIQR